MATITSVGVTRQMSLSAFAEGAQGIDVSLSPSSAAMAGRVVVHAEVSSFLAAVDEKSTDTEPTDTGPTHTGPTDAGSATDTATPTHTATPTDTAPATDTVRPKLWQPTDAYLKDVVDQKILDDYALEHDTLDPDKPPPVAYALRWDLTDPNDPDGDPLPADEVAVRLAEALDKVKSKEKGGKKDPLGWVIAVNLEVSGLENAPLLLTWSLDGLDVPTSWATDNVAYRLIPTTVHDTGSVEVWVPDLETTGQYNVNLTLALESDGAVLSRSEPVEIVNL